MLRSLSVWYWCAQGIGIEAFQQKAAVAGSQMRLRKVDALWRSEALQREAQKDSESICDLHRRPARSLGDFRGGAQTRVWLEVRLVQWQVPWISSRPSAGLGALS